MNEPFKHLLINITHIYPEVIKDFASFMVRPHLEHKFEKYNTLTIDLAVLCYYYLIQQGLRGLICDGEDLIDYTKNYYGAGSWICGTGWSWGTANIRNTVYILESLNLVSYGESIYLIG